MVDSFPMPGFENSWEWTNLWHLGNTSSARVELTTDGLLKVEKYADHTVHLILNGTSSDLKRLRSDAGVQLPQQSTPGVIFGVLGTSRGGVNAQLVVHQFSGDGERISREAVGNGLQAVIVPDPRTESLLLTVRLSGTGSFYVEHIHAKEQTTLKGAPPGKYPMGRATAVNTDPISGSVSALEIALTLRSTLRDKFPLRSILTSGEAASLLKKLVADDYLLEAKSLVEEFNLYDKASLDTLQKMLTNGLKTGYLNHAHSCASEIESRGGVAIGRWTAKEISREIEFLRDPWKSLPQLPKADVYSENGEIIHVVGRVYPKKQNGYTLRTKNIVEAQVATGLKPAIVVQSGGLTGLTQAQQEEVTAFEVPLESLGNQSRSESGLQDWVKSSVETLYHLAIEARPRVIHAHSDFVNAVFASHVGEALSIPVVYEVRGVWEESWITRIAQTEPWMGSEHGMEMFGWPDYFTRVANTERAARERASRIVTLSETMKNYIIKSPCTTVSADVIDVVPNAVVGDTKANINRVREIRDYYRIPQKALIVGYVTTLAAHEDIETLIRAYEVFAKKNARTEHRLMIVGAGPKLDELRNFVHELNINGVLFTGRVDNGDVSAYYAAIDVFVTARPESRVTELVTPLKPFEAMASGCICVFSDIPALREVGGYADGSAEYFVAGDHYGLARVLELIAAEPGLLNDAAREERIKNSHIPTWANNAMDYRDVYEKAAAVGTN